jgi:hypothetical protein
MLVAAVVAQGPTSQTRTSATNPQPPQPTTILPGSSTRRGYDEVLVWVWGWVWTWTGRC